MTRFEFNFLRDIEARGHSQRGLGTLNAKLTALEKGWIEELPGGRYGLTVQGSTEMSWAGMDCYCGGGWRVGHAAGCPERDEDDSDA